ncbi:hypothetical protein H2198_010314 [Neophaeococcomyces mojaviensis]|uniref:Uncharacterized protein n=1 Tax=Neophaeococcomyces mojaviensis TaxID=3383035 RepID=A0ACC2ZRX4_9EURO|nr:hypothetical protein H2198_010314 [Knufia sp. JES_112]
MKFLHVQMVRPPRPLFSSYRPISAILATPPPLSRHPPTRNFCSSPSRKEENVLDRFSLKDRNYIVTGGGQGIGFAMTQAICQMGGNVAVLDRRDTPVDDFNSLSSKHGVKTEYFQTDVTKEESLKGSFEKAIEKLGSVNGLIPAAGITLDKPFLEQTWEEVDKLQQVNVCPNRARTCLIVHADKIMQIMGTFFATQLTVRQMLKQGTSGSIVMIASICAHQAAPGHKLSGYHASKGGVLMLSKALAVELAPHNIRVNTISPGYINSDMTQKLREQYPHLVEIMHKVPPMKRIGQPNDLTGAAVYLLSDASGYTTGSDILITGGLHAGRIEANSV